MRVVVVGATGNVGTSLLGALSTDPEIESVLGLARRRATLPLPKTTWAAANIETADLRVHFRGADVVVHLAWRIQPSRDLSALRRTNVEGSSRVFRAAAEAGVRALVYASSVGVYSQGPRHERVDESWPREGIRTSFYSRHKAAVEQMLDRFEIEHPGIRVVRLRPALIFKREAASGIRRLFLGPLFPTSLLAPGRIPVLPLPRGLRFQAVHSFDVGEAYRLAVIGDVNGAFNIASEPVFDPQLLGTLLDARVLPVPPVLARAGAGAAWRLRLQPTPPGWVDLALGSPLLDHRRATDVLGWRPERSAQTALLDLIDGLRNGAGLETPPLSAQAGGPARVRELATGVGSRDPVGGTAS